MQSEQALTTMESLHGFARETLAGQRTFAILQGLLVALLNILITQGMYWCGIYVSMLLKPKQWMLFKCGWFASARYWLSRICTLLVVKALVMLFAWLRLVCLSCVPHCPARQPCQSSWSTRVPHRSCGIESGWMHASVWFGSGAGPTPTQWTRQRQS